MLRRPPRNDTCEDGFVRGYGREARPIGRQRGSDGGREGRRAREIHKGGTVDVRDQADAFTSWRTTRRERETDDDEEIILIAVHQGGREE